MLVLQIPGTSVHWYGKEVQNKRKLGHITITGADNQEAHQRLHSIDPVAADAMATASDRYTEATSSSEQTQGWSSCALKSAVMASGLCAYIFICACICLPLLLCLAVCPCLWLLCHSVLRVLVYLYFSSSLPVILSVVLGQGLPYLLFRLYACRAFCLCVICVLNHTHHSHSTLTLNTHTQHSHSHSHSTIQQTEV